MHEVWLELILMREYMVYTFRKKSKGRVSSKNDEIPDTPKAGEERVGEFIDQILSSPIVRSALRVLLPLVL